MVLPPARIMRSNNLSLAVAGAEVPKFFSLAAGKIEITSTSPYSVRIHRPNRKERRKEGKT